jgi:hypothetical protein
MSDSLERLSVSPEVGEPIPTLADVLQRLAAAFERCAASAAPAVAGLVRGMELVGRAGMVALRELAKDRDEAGAKRRARRRRAKYAWPGENGKEVPSTACSAALPGLSTFAHFSAPPSGPTLEAWLFAAPPPTQDRCP